MSGYELYSILSAVVGFYQTVIFVYVLMSWFPLSGVFADIYHVLGSVCEPYIGLFRRLIPPIGGTLDVSPIIAIFTLSILLRVLSGIL